MRTFFIFNISKEMLILTKDTPYNLYKTMESIYNLDKKNVSIGLQFYEQLVNPINKDKILKILYENHKNNDYYLVSNNIHSIYNKYRPEDTKLYVNNAYMKLTTNYIKPTFLKDLKIFNNLFVCDFQNKDYFWLISI